MQTSGEHGNHDSMLWQPIFWQYYVKNLNDYLDGSDIDDSTFKDALGKFNNFKTSLHEHLFGYKSAEKFYAYPVLNALFNSLPRTYREALGLAVSAGATTSLLGKIKSCASNTKHTDTWDNAFAASGYSCVRRAAETGQTEILEWLKNNAPGATDAEKAAAWQDALAEDDYFCIRLAAKNGHTETVDFLLASFPQDTDFSTLPERIHTIIAERNLIRSQHNGSSQPR